MWRWEPVKTRARTHTHTPHLSVCLSVCHSPHTTLSENAGRVDALQEVRGMRVSGKCVQMPSRAQTKVVVEEEGLVGMISSSSFMLAIKLSLLHTICETIHTYKLLKFYFVILPRNFIM